MGLLAVAIEEGDVDPPAFVGVLKFDNIGFVKKVGVEDNGPVLPVGNIDRACAAIFQKFLNLVFVLVIVIFGKIPVIGSFLIPHHQPA